MKRLILFDIDGTLLDAGGAGARAFLAAVRDVFEVTPDTDGISFAGKTDPQVARELLGRCGWGRREINARLPELWSVYLGELRRQIEPARVRVLPGVRALLERLRGEQRATLGLLTGNIRGGAQLKLDAAGLPWEWFPLGAFGSDHADRAELPAVAVRRAETATGVRFAGREVVVIGDTPADVRCGERLGVRSVAVATGSYSVEELAEQCPDHLFADLADTAAAVSALLDPAVD